MFAAKKKLPGQKLLNFNLLKNPVKPRAFQFDLVSA